MGLESVYSHSHNLFPFDTSENDTVEFIVTRQLFQTICNTSNTAMLYRVTTVLLSRSLTTFLTVQMTNAEYKPSEI